MSDNLRRYFAIQKALKSLRPTEPKGNVARHLNILARFICGIIGSQKCYLPTIARKVPTDSKPQSRVRRLERFVANPKIDSTLYYLPYVQALLARRICFCNPVIASNWRKSASPPPRMAPFWLLLCGRRVGKNRSSWSPIWSFCRKPMVGPNVVFVSKPC